MPESKAQVHLARAALHGATFPMAAKLRSSMSLGELHKFADHPTKGLPSHVKTPAVRKKQSRGAR